MSRTISATHVAGLQARFRKECMAEDKPHPLVVIYESEEKGPGVTEVVRWCRICGAVVIDIDVDSRTKPGAIMNLQLPETARFNMVAFGGPPVTKERTD